MTELLDFVPAIRAGFLRRDVDGETVVWSPLGAEPVVLDPVATVMLDVIDGEATVGQLADEVHEEVGVALDVAQMQVGRAVELFGRAGLLTVSSSTTPAADAISERDLFISPCTSCMEAAVRGMTSLSVRFGERTVGVACDAKRGARRLGAALSDHVVEDDSDAPVGFVLSAPVGFQRSHQLADRSGFVHSQGRGLDGGLHALAGHLTAFLPPAPGTVRVRGSAIAADDRIVVCLFPLLLVPRIEESELAASGYLLVDRLAIDIEVATGRIVNPGIPWPDLAALGPGAGHRGPEISGRAAAVVSAAPEDMAPLGRAAAVATLASGALHGAPLDVLDAVTRLVQAADVRTTPPEAVRLVDVLCDLGAAVPEQAPGDQAIS